MPHTQRMAVSTPCIPEGMRVYAVGDIHGRCDLLERAFTRIDAHKRAFPIAKSIEVHLGDYIDRGPQSRQVVERMISRAVDPDVIPLIGNHEEFLLQSLEDSEAFPDWMRYGGRETLLSYGIPTPRDSNVRTLEEARRHLRDALPEAHLRFMAECPLTYSCGGYLFVHAGIRPHLALEDQRRSDLLWIRDGFNNWNGGLPAVVVHGHTPVRVPLVQRYKINIDTGAYASGQLTCLALEGARIAFI